MRTTIVVNETWQQIAAGEKIIVEISARPVRGSILFNITASDTGATQHNPGAGQQFLQNLEQDLFVRVVGDDWEILADTVEAGSFDPNDVPNLALDLDANSGYTDLSDDARVMTNSGTAISAGTGPNSHDEFVFSSGDQINTPTILTDDQFTVFIVAKAPNPAADSAIFGQYNAGQPGRMAIGSFGFSGSTQTFANFYANSGTRSAHSTTTAWDNTYKLIEYVEDGGTNKVTIDSGSDEALITGQPYTPHSTLTRIGSQHGNALPFVGSVTRVLLYKRTLDNAERDAVKSYLTDRYFP